MTTKQNRPVPAGRRSGHSDVMVGVAASIVAHSRAGCHRTVPARPIDRILPLLDSVRETGGGWVARCPAHEDRRPSLSIAEGADGRVLLKCFAGCTAEDVVRAVGLRLADLFPHSVESRRPVVRRAGLSEAEAWQRFKAARHRLRLALATMIRETEAAARRAGRALFGDDALVASVKRLGWWEYLLDVLMGDGDPDAQLWAVTVAAEEVRRHGRQG